VLIAKLCRYVKRVVRCVILLVASRQPAVPKAG